MADHVLVHLNTVRPISGVLSLADPDTAFFVSQLPTIFAEADAYGGLVWHKHGLRTPEGVFLETPQELLAYPPDAPAPHITTMAAWTGVKELHGFAHRRRNHVEGMKRLQDWVDRSEGATTVLWWASADEQVTLHDGWGRLQHLRAEGPSPYAFTIQDQFDAPSAARGAA